MDFQVKRKSKGHKCYLCGCRFETIHILRKHVNIHQERDLECDMCGSRFSTTLGLKKHVRIHTGERPYACKCCERRFRQKSTLTAHIANVHENGNKTYVRCKICEKRIKSRLSEICWLCSYRGNSPTVTEKSGNECMNPSETITNGELSDALRLLGQRSNDAENCQLCGTPLQSNDHVYCPECSAKENPCVSSSSLGLQCENDITTISDLKSVTKNNSLLFLNDMNKVVNLTDHQIKPSCLQCMIKFPNLVALREHTVNVHKPNWKFSCDTCTERFASSEACTRHMATHQEYRPFSCLVCNHSFKSQLGLNCHLQCHRTDRPFPCKNCDVSFKTQMSLRAHTVVHQKERPFPCVECGYCFKTPLLLRKHMIVHTGEMPFKCKECGQRFRYSSNLRRHYYLHTKERLFVCQICGKDFAQSCGLKQHEQVHIKTSNVDKALLCPVCGKAYKVLRQLEKHLLTHT